MQENKMGTEPVGKLLISMAFPAIISMSISALYNIVDSIFVSMIGEKALTAVSLVMPMQVLMIALGVGTGVGANSLISRRLGEKRQEMANKAASISLKLPILNYVIFLFIGLLATKPFIGYYTNDPIIREYGTQYMTIACCFCIFLMFQLAIEKVLQATGNMLGSMITSLTGALVNTILDPTLIFGLFGFPRLGVVGAAVATIFGQAASVCVGVFILQRKNSLIKVSWFDFRPDLTVTKEIYMVGFPAIVMQALFGAVTIIYNAILAASATAVAVLGAYFKLESMIFMPLFGLNQGALPILGYNYGAKNRARMMKAFKFSMIAANVFLGASTFLFLFFPRAMLSIFSATDEMYRIGIPALRIICLSFLPAGFSIITATLFQAMGNGFTSMIATIIRQCAVLLPASYLLMKFFGLRTSWYAFPIAEVCGTIYMAIMFVKIKRKKLPPDFGK